MSPVRALHSHRILTPDGLREGTLIWDGARILEVAAGERAPSGAEFESVGDLVVMPGVIDLHVHINEPGRTEWEGFETATRAAAAAGVTTLIDMPLNSSPVTTTAEALALKRLAAEGRIHVHCGFHGGVVPTNAERLGPLLEAGVFGIKAFLTHSGIDEFPDVSLADLERAIPALLQHDALLLVHCEMDSPHAGTTELERSPRSARAWLASRPRSWEDRAIESMLTLAEASGIRLHIVHVSSSDALAMIARAKARGVRVTAETCPHYLQFAVEDIPDGAVQYKCAPPIRERENNERLWEAVRSGVLDLVATDHSPAPPELKALDTGDFRLAWGGVAGLQFGWRSFWTGARARGFTLEQMAERLCSAPARTLGLAGKGRLDADCDADFVVWDPDAEIVVKPEHVLHRHPVTPYVGLTLAGRIERTVVGGAAAYAHARVSDRPSGTLLTARRS